MDVIKELQGLDAQTTMAAMAATVGMLLIYFLILYRREQNLASYQTKVDFASKSNRWIEKKAQELVRIEAYRVAGDLQAHLKKWAEAAELYKKGGNYIRAAQCHLADGKYVEAARAYLESRDYEKAAALFIEHKDFPHAAECYLRAEDRLKAARTFERGGELERAAEIYQELGMNRRAADAYIRKEQWVRAAEALWRSFGQERVRLPEDLAVSDSMPLRMIARQAGNLFHQSGRIEDAVNAYQEGGWLTARAEALEEAGNFMEAAQAFLEAGEALKAAEAYEKAGEQTGAASLRAKHYLELGQEREAVSYLIAAGEHQRAAEILRRLHEWTAAAESYDKAGQFMDAADMYEKAESLEHAAKCLEKAGEFRRAAELYSRAGNPGAEAEVLEKAGDHMAAGANYFERGLLDRSISALQKVEAGHASFSSASFMLGQIFREKGMMELAYEYFKRSVHDSEPARNNLENYYQLAICAERMNNVEEAGTIFEKILVLDFHFKDVADRLNAIRSSKTVVETPSTPSMDDTVSRPLSSVAAEPVSVEKGERYTMIEEIGRGGMGIVYKAQDNILERTVAYKVLPASLRDHPQALKNFFREAKSAARLNHPNIVTVYDAGEEGGTYYIAMEYVEGETVKQILTRERQMPIKAVIVITGQICKALEYAHEKRIVHRDIKSSNVMWTPDKQVKLMDFGLAKVIEEVKGYQTIASGTPYYMSPEQTLGRNIDHRTDLYSLGVTMFELSTGKLPFMHGDAAYHHVHTPPPEAIKLNPAVPEKLNRIILKLMQKKPEDRYQSAADLFKALKEVV